MIFDEIIQFVLDRGYKEYPTIQEHREWGVRAFSKRLPEGAPCECNDHKISWHIETWPEMRLGQSHLSSPSLDIEIVAEQRGGTWFSVDAYSLDINNLALSLGRAEQDLLAAWQTLWRAGHNYESTRDE